MDERQSKPFPRKDMVRQHVSILAVQRRGAPLPGEYRQSTPEDLVELGVPLVLVEPLAARHNVRMSPAVDGTPIDEMRERLGRWDEALSILADLTDMPEDLRRKLDIPVGRV